MTIAAQDDLELLENDWIDFLHGAVRKTVLSILTKSHAQLKYTGFETRQYVLRHEPALRAKLSRLLSDLGARIAQEVEREMTAEKVSLAALLKAEWNEEDHPRAPAGTSEGGQWIGDEEKVANEWVSSIINGDEDALIQKSKRLFSRMRPTQMSPVEIRARTITRLSQELDANDQWRVFQQQDGRPTKVIVEKLLKSWHQTSTNDVNSVMLQRAAKLEFNLENRSTEKFFAMSFNDATRNYSPAERDVELKGLRAFLRVQYDATQRELKAQGVDHLYIYRGSTDKSHISGLVKGEFHPMTSFSIHPATPKAYADFHSRFDKSEIPHTTVAKVKVEDVLSTPFTGIGALKSDEVVVKGLGSQAVMIVPYADSKTDVKRIAAAMRK